MRNGLLRRTDQGRPGPAEHGRSAGQLHRQVQGQASHDRGHVRLDQTADGARGDRGRRLGVSGWNAHGRARVRRRRHRGATRRLSEPRGLCCVRRDPCRPPAATDRIWAWQVLRRGGVIVLDPFLALSGPPLRPPTAWSIFRGSAAEWRSLLSAGAPVTAPTMSEALASWWGEVDSGSATPAALQRLNYFRLARAVGRWVGGRAAQAGRAGWTLWQLGPRSYAERVRRPAYGLGIV